MSIIAPPDWPERFRQAADLNELLALAHRKMQEEQSIAFPLEDNEAAEDSALGFASSFLCNWILFFGPARIESRAQVDEALESFMGTLRQLRTKLPQDDEAVKQAMLHVFKRQLIGPHHPLY